MVAYGSKRPRSAPIVVPALPAKPGKPLLELKPNGCRFIVNSQAGRVPTHLYCGVPVEGAGAGDPPLNCYCALHQVTMGRRYG